MFFISFLVLPLKASEINGRFGKEINSLNISASSVKGSFLGRDYHYSIKKLDRAIELKGLIAGRKEKLVLSQTEEGVAIRGLTAKDSFDAQSFKFASFAEGKYAGKGVSLRIEKDFDQNEIDGFYNGCLNDLRIFKSENGYRFHGYVNCSWTNLEITRLSRSLKLSGKLMQENVEMEVAAEELSESDLFELIMFGFHIPNFEAFNF